jgi:hypothetical protein
MATAPVKTLRRIPKAALSRLQRALEVRGMIPTPQEAHVKPPAEEMVPVGDRWGPSPASLPGLDLCVSRQLELLEQLRRFTSDVPDFRASVLPQAEAVCLYAMMRVLAPKRIFEWGASRARQVMVDAIERSSAKSIELSSLDRSASSARWKELGAGDLLYVDGGDLPYLLFEALPAISAGAYVQFRPVEYPFRRAELLRAFLQYNRDFQIRFWPSYLHQHCRDRLALIPQLNADTGTLWIRKVS